MPDNTDNNGLELPLTEKDEKRLNLLAIVDEYCKKDSSNIDLLGQTLANYINFEENIYNNTRNPLNHMNITQLEEQMTISKEKHNHLLVNLLKHVINNIDEKEIVEKKKEEYLDKGVKLKIYRKLPRSIMTIHGKIDFQRTALLPSTPLDRAKLSEFSDSKHIFPFDEVIGISDLPFKLTVNAMLETVTRVRETSSYEAAARNLARDTGIMLDPETVRKVACHVGEIVFKNDMIEADRIASLLDSGKLEFPEKKKEGVFYIETDGAMLHTREKDEQGSAWKENKLGMVFASDAFITWKTNKGETSKTIGKREYITYVGEVETFKKLLFALAIRNGYGQYEKAILISDGATWIRNMKEELFPDAQQILDFYHLVENTNNFAKAVFDLDDKIYKGWADNVIRLFKASKTNEAIQEVHALGRKKIAKSKFNFLGYIQNNINNIDYAEYKKNGYFIGSGAIESSNRTVLQERLKKPGMRWNKTTGQYILSLMSKIKSDMSRNGLQLRGGIWERDVENAIRKKYEVQGFADKKVY
jgi:hypothetical protein